MTAPTYIGTCRNGHDIRRDIPQTAGEIAGQPSVPIRCPRCGRITECYKDDQDGSATRDLTRSAMAPDPLVADDPDCDFSGDPYE